MKLLIATVGSFGDLHPYIAIALEARARGHEVTLATCAHYKDKVESEGLRFVAIPPDLSGFEFDEEARRRVMHPIDGSRYVIQEVFLPPIEEAYRILLDEAASHDVLLGSTFALGIPLAAHKTGKAWFTSYLQPAAIFSIYDPPQVPAMPIMPWLRRFGTGPIRVLKDFSNRGNRYFLRKLYDLARRERIPASAIPDIFGGASPHGNLILFSKHFMEPTPDFPQPFTQTGFPFYDRLDAHSRGLAPALEEFLAAGAAPVVFTLGTSAVLDPGRFFEDAAESLTRTKRRGVLLVSRLHAEKYRDWNSATLRVVDYAPHSLLMPRAFVNVHQGGVGTTAQALRAGRPMVVVPFSHDQPDNAMRVERLGVAKVIARNQLNASRLGEALTQLEDAQYSERAAALAALLSQEQAAKSAVDALELR
jgi:UDP:flavonoid glycosyltransferase YjiC (YdhE family)